jgi:hypothetical protein
MSTVRLSPQPSPLTVRVPYRLDLFGKKAEFRAAAAEMRAAQLMRPNNRNN